MHLGLDIFKMVTRIFFIFYLMQLSQGCANVPSRLKIFQMVTLQKTCLSDIAGRSTAESGIKIPLNQSNRSQTNKVKLVEGIYAWPHFLNVCPKSVY